MISLPLAPRPAAVKEPWRHISYSSLTTFQKCPLRYYFAYIAGLPEETIASSLLLGTAIHNTLQFHYEELLADNPAPALDLLLDVFWNAWKLHEGKKILFNKGEDMSSIGHLADRMLRGFQRSQLAYPQGNILAVEEEFRGTLIPGLPEMLARIDLVIETEDAIDVIDFKTARSPWSDDHVADSADQLLIYGELAKDLSEGKPLRLAFAVLTKSRIPDLTVHPVTAAPERVDRTRTVVRRLWQAIESQNFYPNPSPLQCPTCPFREPCRAWRV
jgi:putative RecB family exonuclease